MVISTISVKMGFDLIIIFGRVVLAIWYFLSQPCGPAQGYPPLVFEAGMTI